MAELLAPAGSADHIKAAIAAGADAVYLGGKAFNARKYAHNLDNDELKASVETAHLFGVKVYVTVNILISDAEMGELTEYIRFLDEIDTDGIIVQDLAVAAVARKAAPNLPESSGRADRPQQGSGAVCRRPQSRTGQLSGCAAQQRHG